MKRCSSCDKFTLCPVAVPGGPELFVCERCDRIDLWPSVRRTLAEGSS